MTSSNPTSKDMGAMDTKRGRKAALFGSVLLVALNRSKIRPVRPDMARWSTSTPFGRPVVPEVNTM